MSNNTNVVDFPTTATEPDQVQEQLDTSPEGLKKLAEKGIPQVLQLVNKNRKEGVENLRKKCISLQTMLEVVESWRQKNSVPLMVIKDDNDTLAFSLENELRNIQAALDSTLTTVEAHDSLLDMLINDIVGFSQNASAMQNAIMISNGQCQTLIQLLINKGTIKDDEMKDTWNALVQAKQEQFKQQESTAPQL